MPAPIPPTLLGAAPPVSPSVAPATVRWYGKPGTFGTLGTRSQVATGHTLGVTGIYSWGFGAGEGLFYALATPDGKIIMSTVPLTDNELLVTADHAEINVYDPISGLFYANVLPTSTGRYQATNPGQLIGGTDAGAGDLCVTPDGRVLFTLTGAAFGSWDPTVVGSYPSIGFLKLTSGRWLFDNWAQSKTSNQLQATNPTAYNTIAPSPQANGTYSVRGIDQVIPLPVSGNIAIAHYFNGNSFNSGVLSVWDQNANLLCAYQIPSMNRQDGATSILMCPREIKADPSSTSGDERIMIIYDVFGNGNAAPSPAHVMQEFTYNNGAQTITPVTVPFISADDTWSPSSCWYGPDGTFYCASSRIGAGLLSLQAENTSVWVKHAGGDRDFATLVPATGSWATNGSFASRVIPTYSLQFAAAQAIGGSAPLAMDTVTGALIVPGAYNGQLGATIPDKPSTVPDPSVSPAANLLHTIPGSTAAYGFDDVTDLLSTADSLLTVASSVGNWKTIFASCTLTWLASGSLPVAPPNSAIGAGNGIRIQAAANGASAIGLQNAGMAPVVAGKVYGFTAASLAATVGQSFNIFVTWFTSGFVSLGNSSSFAGTDNTSTWTTLYGQGTAPATAAWADLTINWVTTTTGQQHYVANMLVYDNTAPAWTGFVTNLTLDSTVFRSAPRSLALVAPFTQGTVVAQSPQFAVTPGREYWVEAYLRASATAGACHLDMRWFTSAGVLISTSPVTYSPADNTSSFTRYYSGALAPVNAVSAQLEVSGTVANVGDKVYVDDVIVRAQPWQAAARIDTGCNQLRTDLANQTIGLLRPAITGRTLWLPVTCLFTAAESAAYSPSTYAPDTVHPQWLVGVDMDAFLTVQSAVVKAAPAHVVPGLPPAYRPTLATPSLLPALYAPVRPAWHFLYGPPAPAGGYAGEIVQAQSRSFVVRTGATSYSEIDVDVRGADVAGLGIGELLTDMTILWGSQPLLRGRVGPTQDSLGNDGQHRVALTALDYREVLRRRMLLTSLVFTASDPAFIAWRLVAEVQSYPGGEMGITPGFGSSTAFVVDYTSAVADMAGDDIDALAQMQPFNFDWDISPYGPSDLRLCIWTGPRGSNKGLVLEYGGGLVSSMTRQVDPSAYANAVYVTGDSSAMLTPQQIAATDITSRPEGRWDRLIGTTLLTSSALTSAAPWYLADAEVITPTYTIVLRPGAWSGPDMLWLGDMVNVRIKSGRLAVNDLLQVTELAFDISPDGLETVTVTAGRIPFRLHQRFPRMLRQIGKLSAR